MSLRKLFSFTIPAVLACVYMNSACAAPSAATIRDSSIKWGDADKRLQLLALVPVWDESTLKTMFNVYHDSAHNQLPKTSIERQYNVEYINGLWGPLNNPFTKSPRPAKAFISFTNSTEFYMEPLIKNATDGNYYVFDTNQNQPVLLNDWVANIGVSHGGLQELQFNICNGYGDSLNDICMKGYQSEVVDAMNAYNSSNRSLNLAVNRASAHRDINQDWNVIANAPLLTNRAFKSSGSILQQSIAWKKGADKTRLLNTVAAWPNYKIIQANFEKIRDIRYFNDQDANGFMRRISWLFPDDGCWTRATAVIKDLFGPMHNAASQYPRPSKIFAFGNLCVNTDNHSAGYVSWWYHTAPVINDAETGETYVLDPAVDAHKPLTVNQWMATISANSGACGYRNNSVSKFNICSGYGTGPGSNCNSDYSEEESQDAAQPGFQQQERRRQVSLGRDANTILGDTPPWQ